MFERGETGSDLGKMIAESAEAPAKQETELRSEEFAPTKEQKAAQKEKRANQIKQFREKAEVQAAFKAPDDAARLVISRAIIGKEGLNSDVANALDMIQDKTGYSGEEPKRILKDVLTAALESGKIKDPQVVDRLIGVIDQLESGQEIIADTTEDEEELTKAA